MGRYFIAVVPQGLNENPALKQLMAKMKRTVSEREMEARWVHPDLWHVTLSFLGELEDDRKNDLYRAVGEWKPDIRGIDLRMQGVGAFPAEDQARVLWIGVQENQELIDLQAHLARHLASQGFTLENRPFAPHLTLARLRNPQSVADLVQLGGRKHFGDYKISDAVVFESVLQGNIIKYMPQLRLPL
jgi:2'-5' RNA ligase